MQFLFGCAELISVTVLTGPGIRNSTLAAQIVTYGYSAPWLIQV